MRSAFLSVNYLAIIALHGCVTAPIATERSTTFGYVQTGELEAAAPSSTGVGRANTAASASVALGGRRERVRDAVDTYLRAVLDADVERAVAWFAEPTTLVENNTTYRTREQLTTHHQTALGTFDMSYLRLELERETGAPVVRSFAEFRRVQPTGALAVQPGDWVVDLPFVVRAPYTSVARYLPSRMVIRFVGPTAKVVALAALQPLRV
jgi:hypothetical protein